MTYRCRYKVRCEFEIYKPWFLTAHTFIRVMHWLMNKPLPELGLRKPFIYPVEFS